MLPNMVAFGTFTKTIGDEVGEGAWLHIVALAFGSAAVSGRSSVTLRDTMGKTILPGMLHIRSAKTQMVRSLLRPVLGGSPVVNALLAASTCLAPGEMLKPFGLDALAMPHWMSSCWWIYFEAVIMRYGAGPEYVGREMQAVGIVFGVLYYVLLLKAHGGVWDAISSCRCKRKSDATKDMGKSELQAKGLLWTSMMLYGLCLASYRAAGVLGNVIGKKIACVPWFVDWLVWADTSSRVVG